MGWNGKDALSLNGFNGAKGSKYTEHFGIGLIRNGVDGMNENIYTDFVSCVRLAALV